MPFSIRRLAHLNRSQSLQSRKDGSKSNSSDVPAAGTDETAVNISIRSSDQQQASTKLSKSMGSKASKSSKSSKSGHKQAGASDSAASSAAARNEVNQLVALASQQQQQIQQQQQQLQQQHHEHSAYLASHHASGQQSHHQQNALPPSFVIRNQTTIPGSAFQPVHPAQSTHHQHPMSSSGKYESAQLPNSRSLDSNEIRRFNAAVASAAASANQSSKLPLLMKYSLAPCWRASRLPLLRKVQRVHRERECTLVLSNHSVLLPTLLCPFTDFALSFAFGIRPAIKYIKY